MQNNTLTQQEVGEGDIKERMPLTWILAIIASQTRLLQIIEKIYGDSAFSNPVFAEYKRALETIEKEAKDNLVI